MDNLVNLILKQNKKRNKNQNRDFDFNISTNRLLNWLVSHAFKFNLWFYAKNCFCGDVENFYTFETWHLISKITKIKIHYMFNPAARWCLTVWLFETLAGMPEQQDGRGAVKKLRAMETYKKKSLPITLPSFQQQWSPLITSKIIKETRKFVSIRSWYTMKLPMMLLWKRHLRPGCPFERSGGNSPLSDIPAYRC